MDHITLVQHVLLVKRVELLLHKNASSATEEVEVVGT